MLLPPVSGYDIFLKNRTVERNEKSRDKWIFNTFKKHGVNIFAFCEDWCSYFSDTPNLWEKWRKKRNHDYDSLLEYGKYDLSSYMFWDYDYKPGGERFGLNSLYRNMPKKDYTRIIQRGKSRRLML